jgi:hypothetical protein
VRPARQAPMLLALVVAGVVASAAIGGVRHRVEAAYRTVELVLDAEDWTLLAQREGRDPETLWRALRFTGATSVAVYEATLRRLAEEGRVTYRSGAELQDAWRLGVLAPPLRDVAQHAHPGALYVLPGDPEVAALVRQGFRTALGADRVDQVLQDPVVLRVRGRPRDLEETSLGFLPSTVRRWEARGFRVVLRPRNVRSFTPQRLRERVASYAKLGTGRTVVFDLNEVLGYERAVEEAAAALRSVGAVYGRVEVLTPARRMRGEEAMTEALRPWVVRVVSVPPEELERLPVPEAVDRFARGVRERNLRLVYVRPYLQTPGGVDPVAHNLDYVARIAQAVRQAGFELGAARPFPVVPVSAVLFSLALLAACAAGVLCLAAVLGAAGVQIPERFALAMAAASAGLAWAGVAAGYELWVRKLYALGASVAFPVLAVLWASEAVRAGLGSAVAGLWAASSVSAAGGLVVAALLTAWPFLTASEVFPGVKVATVLPLVLVGAALAARADPEASAQPGSWSERLRGWLGRPVSAGALLAAGVVAGVLAVLLLRTGNTALPLVPLEERLRDALERALVARPRTKEYLLGHPALVLALAAPALGLRRWRPLLLLAGVVGQAGLVNSFSHLHTPLLYTVWRTVNALVLGSVLGVILYGVVAWALRRLAPVLAPARASPPGPRTADLTPRGTP